MGSLRALLAGACVCVPVLASGQPNGISVSPAKVFDNRALVIMLEQLEAQLRSLQAIDQQKVVQGLGSLQGAQVSDVTRTLSVTGPGAPAVTTTEGISGGELAVTGRVTTQEARAAPAAPSPAPAPSTLTHAPPFGMSAQDLLADQISLTYQIFNVRMLLERALSDRLHDGEKPRLQTVLGFQIGLDPPRNANGRAAVAEITVADRSGKPLSLVSVMPQEKTYNAYALDRRSNAFGGAAVASILTLGYGEQRRNEVLYLYKDADTLAILNPTPAAESASVTFGWVFRPVLGRPAVSPGIRQMFAVIALSEADKKSAAGNLAISVRTHWRKYDRKRMTLDTRVNSEVFAELGSVDIRSSADVASALAPRIRDIEWTAVDPETAVVTIQGENLFAGTQVLLGRTAYSSPATGLFFKSDQILELRASMRDIAFGDPVISGRYGAPVPLEVKLPDKFASGIRIDEIFFKVEPVSVSIPIRVQVEARDGRDLKELPSERPLLTVGTAVAYSLNLQPGKCNPPAKESAADTKKDPPPPNRKYWCLTGVVPVTALERDPMVILKFPFRGKNWADGYPIQPAVVTGITRIGGDKMITLAITGRKFSDRTKVILDREYVNRNKKVPETLIMVDVSAETLARYKKLVVEDDYRHPIIVDIPEGSPRPQAPVIDRGQQPRVRRETSVGITLTGSSLTAIKAATFEGRSLRFQVLDNGRKLVVFVTRDVTAKLGEAVILLETADGIIPVTVIVEA